MKQVNSKNTPNNHEISEFSSFLLEITLV
ncbi:hypothetical protein CAEBREN_00772 [Caenorhabditis brenneri]|uniref:Uncharacterized protein n=1 Tax=Caenorhabditis brenneri TaxID=135651 RepID=G0MRY7_CAEBE|nr:hypothetical protein CAEBREN_00772 [Caenorhabditis brenneri]